MKLSDAAAHIDAKVVYRPYRSAPAEEGVITSTNRMYVFVRFGADVHSKAVMPDYLTLLAIPTTSEETCETCGRILSCVGTCPKGCDR